VSIYLFSYTFWEEYSCLKLYNNTHSHTLTHTRSTITSTDSNQIAAGRWKPALLSHPFSLCTSVCLSISSSHYWVRSCTWKRKRNLKEPTIRVLSWLQQSIQRKIGFEQLDSFSIKIKSKQSSLFIDAYLWNTNPTQINIASTNVQLQPFRCVHRYFSIHFKCGLLYK